jgi:hypothetical protein
MLKHVVTEVFQTSSAEHGLAAYLQIYRLEFPNQAKGKSDLSTHRQLPQAKIKY